MGFSPGNFEPRITLSLSSQPPALCRIYPLLRPRAEREMTAIANDFSRRTPLGGYTSETLAAQAIPAYAPLIPTLIGALMENTFEPDAELEEGELSEETADSVSGGRRRHVHG